MPLHSESFHYIRLLVDSIYNVGVSLSMAVSYIPLYKQVSIVMFLVSTHLFDGITYELACVFSTRRALLIFGAQ